MTTLRKLAGNSNVRDITLACMFVMTQMALPPD